GNSTRRAGLTADQIRWLLQDESRHLCRAAGGCELRHASRLTPRSAPRTGYKSIHEDLMKLAQLPFDLGLETVRDAEFATLGFVTHQTPDLLVFLESEEYLRPLLDNQNVTCVIASPSLVGSLPAKLGVAVSTDPRGAFCRLHDHLSQGDFYWKSF